MLEKLVGETGFEPATLCSQSRQDGNEINGSAVNRGDFRANQINGLQIGCKLSGGRTRDGTPRKRSYKAGRRAAVYKIERTCVHCGTSFVATKNPAQKHCSPGCRLWSWVAIGGRYDCWHWTGTRNRDGYGSLRIEGKHYPAHRLTRRCDELGRHTARLPPPTPSGPEQVLRRDMAG